MTIFSVKHFCGIILKKYLIMKKKFFSTTTIVTITLLLSTGNHGYLNNFFYQIFFTYVPLIF